MKVTVIPFDISAPGDARGLRKALSRIDTRRLRQLAVIAKIEGPATLNDSSRELASERIKAELLRVGGATLMTKTTEILSVGCEGITTPGGWLIATSREPARRRAGPGLAVGLARSAPIAMQDRAGIGHIRAAASAVRAAMRQAGLAPSEVELVLIKSPILLPEHQDKVGAAQRRHVRSTGASRGAAALGAALALGELRLADVRAEALCSDWSLHGSRTMAFSGTETDCCEVVLMGHARNGDPSLRIERRALRDLLDRDALSALAAGDGEIRVIFFKAGIAADGRIRGARTTVTTSELPADKQLRAAASGVVGAMLGTTRAFISGGAEHQAAPGGCIAAIIRSVHPAGQAR